MLSLQDVMQTVYNSDTVEMTPILQLQNFLSMCKHRGVNVHDPKPKHRLG
jgi:hypothetical protein